jgi:hypothetical protein
MGNEHPTMAWNTTMPMTTMPTTRPPLAVRQPRHVEGDPVETERNLARLETVLASLRPPV